ncbi:M10 family metallopeptidase C-terminal domain-containing protein [Sphingosinicella sp. BN140058]|uniref:M10 family metallopeptidase C-terminal domain-containing protein n=1 Tax=Sphingosinicella sp. BN140058 TaxID=1892855 RepID=UPI001012B05E|nr:M10 family metallopeptidase C-terminal domain-containing protein [Sphingosinicella sp. BN140058]QAY75222.1 hypothetical protein ETR14_00755 [Sphingosinicella sp. BN140058]
MPIIVGTARADRLEGSDTSDLITGNGGDDLIFGGRGNDQLVGGAGDDTLRGGNGNDYLKGGTGNDILYGGNGYDRFIFEQGAKAQDWVKDFQHDVDKIDLSDIDANSNRAGNQAFNWIGYQAFTGHAGEARVYQGGDNSYIAMDFNGDARADMTIAFDNHPVIGLYDMIL